MAGVKTPAQTRDKRVVTLKRHLAELTAKVAEEQARTLQLEQAAAGYERQRILQALHDSVC